MGEAFRNLLCRVILNGVKNLNAYTSATQILRYRSGCQLNKLMIYHIVIQTTEGRKNLEDILVDIFVDVPEILRFALNDN